MFNSVWYNSLTKPFLSPSPLVFAPMWTILYLMMFVALTIFLLKQTCKNKSWGIWLFFSQLTLNLCWTPAFFYLKNIILALAIVVTLDALVLMTIIEFYKVSKNAAFWLVPYFLWILFATYLNFGYMILN